MFPRRQRWAAAAVALFMTAGMPRTQGEIVNTEVKRKIDVSTNVAKVSTIYAATGLPASGGKYKFGLPLDRMEHLAYFRASAERKPVEAKRVGDEGAFAMFEVKAKGASDGTYTLKVFAVYTGVLTPYPKEITQLEDQMVVYEDVLLAPTPYKTAAQSTTVLLASETIEDYSGNPPRVVKGDSITYGPYYEAAPLVSQDRLRVHYVNHAPFAKAESCLREIEVSSWGNIAVEELYELVHDGAALKGGFSRLDYGTRRSGYVPNPSFRMLNAVLPPSARDIYYRDRIGNISTSAIKQNKDNIELQLATRYPIFGGWRTSWYQGYNMPTEAGLTKQGPSSYTLRVAFGAPFNVMWADDFTVKVILPEGATNVKASVPFEVEESRTRRFTYLDTALLGGRPVVTLHKRNVVHEHNVKFAVTYDFKQIYMLHEPLLLVGAFLAFFLLCVLALRLDLRIRDDGANGGGGKAKQKEA